MRRIVAPLIGVLLVLGSAGPGLADWGCSHWRWVEPTPEPLDLYQVAFGDDSFLAFGRRQVMSSPDGIEWVVHRTDEGCSTYCGEAIWDGLQWVGLRDGVAVSPDGFNWTQVLEVDNPGEGCWLADLAFNGQMYVAVGGCQVSSFVVNGLIYVSDDALQWQSIEVPPGWWPHSIDWSGEAFLMTGGGLWASPDGITWSLQDGPALFDLVVGAPGLVGVGDTDLWFSADGFNWQQTVSHQGLAGDAWYGGGPKGIWDGNHFLLVGNAGQVWSSPNGVQWSEGSIGAGRQAFDLEDVVAGNRRAVAVGRGIVSQGGDGTWSHWMQESIAPASWRSTASSAEATVVVSRSSILVSEDLEDWREAVPPADGFGVLSEVTSDGQGFVAVGEGGLVLSSEDGTTWRREATPIEDNLSQVAATSDVRVGMAYPAVIITSTAGGPWQQVELPDTVLALGPLGIQDVAAGDGLFVASAGGYVPTFFSLVSDNGIDWQAVEINNYNPDPGYHTSKVDWAGGAFIVGPPTISQYEYSGPHVWSRDGLEWHVIPFSISSLVPAGDRFLGRCEGRLCGSLDGFDWDVLDGHIAPWSGPIAWTGDGLLAAGYSGTGSSGPGFRGLRRSRCGEILADELVPGMADLAGAENTYWQSDLELHNPGHGVATVSIEMLERGNPTDDPPGAVLAIPPGTSSRLDPALERLFGYHGAATLSIKAWDSPVISAARTFNRTPDGSFGQGIEGLRVSSATAFGDQARLIHLGHSADRSRGVRTNIGLINVSPKRTTLELELWSADGAMLRRQLYVLDAEETIQLFDVFGGLGLQQLDAGFAVVRCLTTERLFSAYASVVDNRSGDPTFIAPQKAAAAGETLVIPALANTEGQNQSQWRSDLELHNPDPGQASVALQLWRFNGAPGGRVTLDLSADTSIRVGDVLGTLFHRSGVATLEVEVLSGTIMTCARTYHEDESGSFGQLVPGHAEERSIGGGQQARLLALSQVEGMSRTHVGLVNLDADPVTVTIDLFRADGTRLGSRAVGLAGRGAAQLHQVFSQITGDTVAQGYAVVTPEAGLVLAYGSVVDFGTNDPLFVAAAP